MNEESSLQDNELQELLLGLLPPNNSNTIINIDLKQCDPKDFQFTLEVMANVDTVSRDLIISAT